MIRATNHIGICVSDMEQCIPFYEGVLGLKRVYDDEMTGHFLDTVQGRENMHYRIVKFASPEGFIVELLQTLRTCVSRRRKIAYRMAVCGILRMKLRMWTRRTNGSKRQDARRSVNRVPRRTDRCGCSLYVTRN